MRILVTGAGGFVGPFLVKELLAFGHEVFLSTLDQKVVVVDGKGLPAEQVNLTNPQAVDHLISQVKPDSVIHLAAMAHVGKSWENRKLLFEVNVGATANVCDSMSRLTYEATLLFISSAMVYGPPQTQEAIYSEDSLPRPNSPYGCSKLAAEHVSLSFATDQLATYIVRPFNHTGPGQSPDYVLPAFAKRVIEAEDGGTIRVGNIGSQRDFSDVRDVVRAYRLIVEKKPDERLFVLGSGRGHAIENLLNRTIELSGKQINKEVDPSLLRPNDPAKIIADTRLAKEVLGWETEIPFEKTIEDVYQSLLEK